MSVKSRTQNSIRNTIFGFSAHLLTALFSFVSRTVFVYVLGAHYLGINGLFSNIFTMLSLTDLGVYTAMVYSLYKPLADGDQERISALINFFRKLYNVIALIVFFIGLCCIPLLPYLVKNSALSQKEIFFYYILLLTNTAVSYLAISKSTLLRADQQTHIVQVVSSSFTFALQISQIVILILTKNYALYLVMQILLTLTSNFILSLIASKKYPYLKKNMQLDTSSEIKKEIASNIKSTFLYKIGNVILNSTDNILISSIVGTVFVGYYSNYVTVFTMINSFIMIFIQGILASVGNYFATQTASQKYFLFRTLLLLFYMIASLCTACYICGMDDFITLWLGSEYVLGGGFVFALALNRFVFCSIHPLWITRESSGIFTSTRFVMLIAAVINIILSVILGIVMGVSGIILATAISYLVTVFWYEPIQLCKKVFFISSRKHFLYLSRLLVMIFPIFFAAVFLKQLVATSFWFLFFKFFLCLIVTVLSVLLTMGRTQEFKKLTSTALKFFKRKK